MMFRLFHLKYLNFLLIFILCFLLLCSIYEDEYEKPSLYTVNALNDNISFSFYNVSLLPSTDYNSLINISDFKFIINNFPCNESYPSPFLLILVHSNPYHFTKRNIIRKTWGKYDDSVKLLFLIGSVNSYSIQNQLIAENNLENDIIQGNFYDTYQNLTYKHTMALKWTTYFCKSAKYVLKADDDIFVNIRFLMKFLSEDIYPHGARKHILCYTYLKSAVKRSYRSKWRISPFYYKDKYYPPYCAGFGIIYSADVVFQLYEKAQRSQYFWIDDVFITGIIASRLNLSYTSLESLVLTEKRLNTILQRNKIDSSIFIFGPPDLSELQIETLWSLTNDQQIK